MDLEVDHGTHAEEQFWDELDETLSQDCETHSHIDDVLRSYLTLIAESKQKFLESGYDLGRCSFKLACSPLFRQHADYVRRQFFYSLLQEEEPHVLLVTISFLLADARTTEQMFELLNEEGAFPRLVQLIQAPKQNDEQGLHRMLMELLYEMARIQKISLEDLDTVTDDFVRCLFDIIEQVSDDVSDPYHYPVIRVLLVMNEQFMVAAHDPEHSKRPVPVTNRVVKVLSAEGSKYKTFGENIILLLNREDETSLQLLTLKLLYLLFTTPPTYEYFYTNDLHVLVDILIRNLLDLPEEASALRHTYLRVLYPLLEHTQLQDPPHYKRNEIQKLLTVLSGAHVSDPDSLNPNGHWTHFDAIDDTTKRLVRRCKGVSWLADPELEAAEQTQSPVEETESGPSSPVSPTKTQPPALPAPRKLRKRDSSKGSTLTIGQFLSPHLESARQSSLSVMEMAAQKEKPGVITPSRNPSLKHGLRAVMMMNKKEKPPIPKARRSGLAHSKMERTETGLEVTNTHVEEIPKAESPVAEDQDPLADGRPVPEAEPEVGSIAPRPPNSTKPSFKKPPPAPKARRWRGKRTKEEDEGGGGARAGLREPGKFSTKMPSIVTSTEERVPEQSPFSPVEKTLSPTSTPSGDIADGPDQPKSSIAEALGQAQAMAVSGIAETLDRATFVDSTEPEVILESPEEDDREYHDVLPEDHEHEHEHQHIRRDEMQRPPQVVLAPPNEAPPRSIPGPEWDLERSPFLSDADDDSDDEITRPGKGNVDQR